MTAETGISISVDYFRISKQCAVLFCLNRKRVDPEYSALMTPRKGSALR